MRRFRWMIAWTAVLSLLWVTASVQAQVRRNVGGQSDQASEAPNDPAQDNQEEPAAGESEESADSENGDDQRQVDPEWIARMVQFRGPMWLLEQEAIRKELKISDEQYQRLQQVDSYMESRQEQTFDQLREQREQQERLAEARARALGPGAGGVAGRGPGGRGFGGFDRDFFRQFREQMQSESDQAIASVLSPEQRQRLEQILLQARGPMAVADPMIMERLRLRPDQRQRIAMIMQQMEVLEDQNSDLRRQVFRSAMQNQRGGDDDDRRRGRRRFDRENLDPQVRSRLEELETKGEQIEQEALRQIGRTLTSGQKRRYNNMLGEPFDFSKLQINSRWGRRGRDRGDDDRRRSGDDENDQNRNRDNNNDRNPDRQRGGNQGGEPSN